MYPRGTLMSTQNLGNRFWGGTITTYIYIYTTYTHCRGICVFWKFKQETPIIFLFNLRTDNKWHVRKKFLYGFPFFTYTLILIKRQKLSTFLFREGVKRHLRTFKDMSVKRRVFSFPYINKLFLSLHLTLVLIIYSWSIVGSALIIYDQIIFVILFISDQITHRVCTNKFAVNWEILLFSPLNYYLNN